MAARKTDQLYYLHIQLADIEPPIWRRIVVPGQITLFRLHQIVQVVMGWTFSHLHQFIVDEVRYGEPDPEFDEQMKHDQRVQLRKIVSKEGDRFLYEYDFGDSWRHEITVERIEPMTAETYYILQCFDGERACPPEDCGGVSGFEQLCEALRDQRHPEHRELRAWAGKHYDPNLFSLQAVNSALDFMISLGLVEYPQRESKYL
ncbi:MAG TPA: plasmid pRiA4b ORF-3 family protein [Ktedonobacteraceae bacterium]|nr:plasmid pRiA4b ORF-3 family protein [Ktedonobacteraceae bacterium]